MDDMIVSNEFRSAIARMIRVKHRDATDDDVEDQIKIIATRTKEARERLGVAPSESGRRMQLRIIDSDEAPHGYDWLVWLDKVH